MAQVLISPLSYTLGLQGVNQLEPVSEPGEGGLLGSHPTWNSIPSPTSLVPECQSTNRWGCLEPGDITQSRFHVFSFLFKSLPLLLAPSQESPRLRWRSPGSDFASAADQKHHHHTATLPSALSEPQLPYGTWGWGGVPSGSKSEITAPVWPSRGDATDWTVTPGPAHFMASLRPFWSQR